MLLLQEFGIDPPEFAEPKGFEPSLRGCFAAPRIERDLPNKDFLEPSPSAQLEDDQQILRFKQKRGRPQNTWAFV